MYLGKGWVAVVVLLLLSFASCREEERPQAGSYRVGPRIPDAEGVVTDVNNEKIEINGKNTYEISQEVESFRALETHEVTPLAHLQGRYVHLGIKDDLVVWITGIGLVIPGPPKEVFFPGRFLKMVAGRALFRDGTTLKLAPGVTIPKRGDQVDATIDPTKDLVVELRVVTTTTR